MTHLGLNVYFWGSREQDRLLGECLGPLAGRLREQGRLEWFWFDRFDARGPHVFALFTVPPGEARDAARQIEEGVAEYLRLSPSPKSPPREDLERWHAECRGKAQSPADREPGIAANNTWLLFEHDPRDYPLWLTRGLAEEAELWSSVDELARWSIEQIARSPGSPPIGSAARWAAELDRALRPSGTGSASWRYHATTLLLPLKERLATEEAAVLEALPAWIGEKNLAAFSRVWERVEGGAEDITPGARRIAEIANSLPAGPEGPRCRLLRETAHWVFKQLGLPVLLHIPLVLFAWSRNLGTPS